MDTFVYESKIEASVEDLFRWHEQEGAFRRLAPPWQFVEILNDYSGLSENAEILFRVSLFGLPIHWLARLEEFSPPHKFVDIQVKGPFAYWRHEHLFEREEPTVSRLRDEVTYQLPGGDVIDRMAAAFGREMLERLFSFRHEIVKNDLAVTLSLSNLPRVEAVEGDEGFFLQQLRAFFSCSQGRSGKVKLNYTQTNDHEGMIQVSNKESLPEELKKGFNVRIDKDSPLLKMKLKGYHFALEYRKHIDDTIYAFARHLSENS